MKYPRERAIVFGAASILFVACYFIGDLREKPPVTFMHRPAAGCPAGWVPMWNAFLEADGSHQDACWHDGFVHNRREMVLDVLHPGERVSLTKIRN